MKIIEVSSPKYGVHQVFVDDEMYDRVSYFTWTLDKDINTCYVRTYIRVNGKRISFSMHRLILGNFDTSFIIDHRDRNGLNNCITNLRESDYSKNAQNMSIYGVSQYKGVTLDRSRNCFRSRIKCNYISYYLGSFPNTPEGNIAAANAYDKKALELYGKDAALNFPLIKETSPHTTRDW